MIESVKAFLDYALEDVAVVKALESTVGLLTVAAIAVVIAVAKVSFSRVRMTELVEELLVKLI